MLKDILKILENDARTTSKQIATMTGTAHRRCQQTHREGGKRQDYPEI